MDINTLAKSIVDQATGEKPIKKSISLGAKKRGHARAESLSPEDRSAIARKAAKKRWDGKSTV